MRVDGRGHESAHQERGGRANLGAVVPGFLGGDPRTHFFEDLSDSSDWLHMADMIYGGHKYRMLGEEREERLIFFCE